MKYAIKKVMTALNKSNFLMLPLIQSILKLYGLKLNRRRTTYILYRKKIDKLMCNIKENILQNTKEIHLILFFNPKCLNVCYNA